MHDGRTKKLNFTPGPEFSFPGKSSSLPESGRSLFDRHVALLVLVFENHGE